MLGCHIGHTHETAEGSGPELASTQQGEAREQSSPTTIYILVRHIEHPVEVIEAGPVTNSFPHTRIGQNARHVRERSRH